MKKIFFLLFMFFIIPFSASASSVTQTITIDYKNLDILNSDTFDNFEYANSLIDIYNDTDENFIVTTGFFSNNLSVNIYFFEDDNDVNIISKAEPGRTSGVMLTSSSKYKVCYFSSSEDLQSQLDDCNSSDYDYNYNTALMQAYVNDDGLVTGLSSISYLPYYSSFDVSFDLDKNFPLIVGIDSFAGMHIPSTEGSKYLFYKNYTDGTILNTVMPSITFNIASKEVDELTDTITSIMLEAKINRRSDDYIISYSLNSGSSFTTYEKSSNTVGLSVNENTTVIFKVLNKYDSSLTRSYTFTVTGIGKPSDYYDNVLDNKYAGIIDSEDEDGNSLGSMLTDVLDGYFSLWSDNFPILSQIGDLLNFFSLERDNNFATCVRENEDGEVGFVTYSSMGWNPVDGTHYNRNYCLPEIELDFSKVIPSLDVQAYAIDFSFFNKYRDVFFTFIKIVVGALTFFKVIKILEVTFKR